MHHDVAISQDQIARYDGPTIVFHWLTAALVGTLWVIGQTVNFPARAWRVDYRSVHIVLGAMLICVLAARLVWRLSGGLAVPPDRHRLLAAGAKAIHWTLYLLLTVTLGLGVTYAWARGDSIFNLFRIPSFAPGNRTLISQIGGWHALAANAVLILAGLHAIAALSHHYVLRDEVLARMAPIFRRRSQRPSA
ncbi:MAG TPA: cytochrome b/b6 domain-containing protein, partial [Acetobacteraceae bacterium]